MNRMPPYGYQAMFPRPGRMAKYLIGICIGVFIIQNIFFPRTPFLFHLFELHASGVGLFQVWRYITYQFLHGSFLHLLGNMLVLYFFGRELEEELGERHMLILYLACGVVGGVVWQLLEREGGVMIGASASALGLLTVYAVLHPERRITLLLYFIVPVTLRMRTLAIIVGVLSLWWGVMGATSNVAHAAHLGGCLAGAAWAFWLKKRKEPFRMADGMEYQPPPQPDLDWDEVNRILEKLQREGIHRLSPRERDILLKASRSKRARR